MTIDRGITIRQPWASLIGLGVKTWETRSRPTSYRGPVMIHAAKIHPEWGLNLGSGWRVNPDDHGVPWLVEGSHKYNGGNPRWFVVEWHPLPLGAVVAVADIVDSYEIMQQEDPRQRHKAKSLVPLRDKSEMKDYLFRCAEGLSDPVEDITDQLPYGDWSPGRWAHQLANVRPLAEPVPCKGSPAYPWRADQATIDAVAEQIEGA